MARCHRRRCGRSRWLRRGSRPLDLDPREAERAPRERRLLRYPPREVPRGRVARGDGRAVAVVERIRALDAHTGSWDRGPRARVRRGGRLERRDPDRGSRPVPAPRGGRGSPRHVRDIVEVLRGRVHGVVGPRAQGPGPARRRTRPAGRLDDSPDRSQTAGCGHVRPGRRGRARAQGTARDVRKARRDDGTGRFDRRPGVGWRSGA